jgi:hypothetical protein
MAQRDEREPAAGNADLDEALEPQGFFRQLENFFKKPESLTPVFALLLFVGLLAFGGEAIEKGKAIQEVMQGFLANAFEPAATGEVKAWFLLLAITFLGILFIAVLYSVGTFLATRNLRTSFSELRVSERSLRTQYQEVTSERDRLSGELSQVKEERNSLRISVQEERERMDSLRVAIQQERKETEATLVSHTKKLETYINETVQAVSMIGRQLFPPAEASKGKTIRSVRITYHINKNFDAEVHRRYVIRAGESPLHFWQSGITAPADALPMPAFSDIGYQLLSRDPGKEVVYLPAENDSFSKSACIFFLPLVEPGENREIEVVYRWPGLLLRLPKVGWEDFTFSFRSVGAIEAFELEIFMEDGTGGQLNLTEKGVPLPGKTVDAVKNDRGWRGWRYAGKNIPPALLSAEIVARLEWTRS